MAARPLGETGRRIGLKIRCRKACRFKSGRGHHPIRHVPDAEKPPRRARRLFLETASGRGRPGALLNRWRAGELEPAGEIRDDDQRDRDTDHPEQCAFHGFFSLELNLSGLERGGPGPVPGGFKLYGSAVFRGFSRRRASRSRPAFRWTTTGPGAGPNS